MFQAIGEEVTDQVVADLAGQGLPAQEVYQLMRELSDQYAETSFSFLE